MLCSTGTLFVLDIPLQKANVYVAIDEFPAAGRNPAIILFYASSELNWLCPISTLRAHEVLFHGPEALARPKRGLFRPENK
jgi:hypothetical protein